MRNFTRRNTRGNICVTIFSKDSPISHILDIDFENFARASQNQFSAATLNTI